MTNSLVFTSLLTLAFVTSAFAQEGWKKHVVYEGERCNTAVAADFTGDGVPDIISNCGGKTRLFIAPKWLERVIDETKGHNFIHSEHFDVDGDGDEDFIGARYQPGLVVWMERPESPTAGAWKVRVVDQEINGIHGLLKGDVDGDGKIDLLANSAQPVGAFPNSGAWLKVPKKPHQAKSWQRNIFAQRRSRPEPLPRN